MALRRRELLISRNVTHQENMAQSSLNRNIPLCEFLSSVSTGHRVDWRPNAATNCHAFLITFEFNYICLPIFH
jgi:hypothetical protein